MQPFPWKVGSGCGPKRGFQVPSCSALCSLMLNSACETTEGEGSTRPHARTVSRQSRTPFEPAWNLAPSFLNQRLRQFVIDETRLHRILFIGRIVKQLRYQHARFT